MKLTTALTIALPLMVSTSAVTSPNNLPVQLSDPMSPTSPTSPHALGPDQTVTGGYRHGKQSKKSKNNLAGPERRSKRLHKRHLGYGGYSYGYEPYGSFYGGYPGKLLNSLFL